MQHAGHYAFLALGRVLAKTLPDEDGPTGQRDGVSEGLEKKDRHALDQDQILYYTISESKHDPVLPGPEYHIIRRYGQLHTRTIRRDQI